MNELQHRAAVNDRARCGRKILADRKFPLVDLCREAAIVREVARYAMGLENLVDTHEIVTWSEDMAFMQQQRPGAYFLIGARGPEKGSEPHHSDRFDIDERALDVGLKMMVALGLHP